MAAAARETNPPRPDATVGRPLPLKVLIPPAAGGGENGKGADTLYYPANGGAVGFQAPLGVFYPPPGGGVRFSEFIYLSGILTDGFADGFAHGFALMAPLLSFPSCPSYPIS